MSKLTERPEDENLELYTGYTYNKTEIIGILPDTMLEIARLGVYQYVVQSQLEEIEKGSTHFRYEPEPYSDDTIIVFYKKI